MFIQIGACTTQFNTLKDVCTAFIHQNDSTEKYGEVSESNPFIQNQGITL